MSEFNYKDTTKNRYKDQQIAAQYAQEYLGPFKFKSSIVFKFKS